MRILQGIVLISSLFSCKAALKGHSQPNRRLMVNDCIGSTLGVGRTLKPGEALCVGDVQYGIFAYDEGNGFVDYRVELRQAGNLFKFFRGIGTSGDPPFLFLQHDGHLLFGDNMGYTNCIVLPGRHGNQNHLKLTNDGYIELEITDMYDDAVWRWDSVSQYAGCYPDMPDTCHSALYKDERISWKEYLCLYDSAGEAQYRYGLDVTGLLGLWRYNELIYRPQGNGWARGDYFHFQGDGHLTLYRDLDPKVFTWTSDDCIDPTASKLVMTSDGDVQEVNEAGAIVWALLGSEYDDAMQDPNDDRDTVPELCKPQ